MYEFCVSEYLEQRNKSQGLCKLCKKVVTWSKERVAAHKRSNCSETSDNIRRIFAKRRNDFSAENPSPSASTADSQNDLPKQEVDDINSKLARFFLRTGIAFRVIESDAFKDLILALNSRYAKHLPSVKTLSGKLLDDQYEKYSVIMQEVLRSSDRLTLVTDGWTNLRGDHIVNFCISSPDHKPVFFRSLNTSGTTQNAENISTEIIRVVEELGPQKFISVITDNAPAMKAAWRIIEEKFPHICAYGCGAHGVNLLIKDILDTNENSKAIKDGEKIIKFVSNHHIVKAKYETLRAAANVSHTLSLPVATRWYSKYTSMNNLLSSKYVLNQLIDESFDELKAINPKSSSLAVINLVKNPEFWTGLQKMVKEIEYPTNVIGKLEGNESELSKVYYYFVNMYENSSDATVREKIKSRLKFLFHPCVGLSYLLTPVHAAKGIFLDNQKIEIMSSVAEIAVKSGIDDLDTLRKEMIEYVADMKSLTGNRAELIYMMNMKQYWNIEGSAKFPMLAKIALNIGAMICSSALSERTWSTFRFIHSRLRNRLTNEKVNKLVFIYTNCVSLDKFDQTDYILEEGAVLNGNEIEF